MTPATQGKGAIDFARAVDARIVTGFTVSPGVRDASDAWTPRMANPWLAYTRAAGGEIHAAELFNEANASAPGQRERAVPAEDYARDSAPFGNAVRKAAPQVKLVGPGVALMGTREAMERQWRG